MKATAVPMEFTTIPNIKEKVSRIGLGTWSMGGSLWGGSDEDAAIQTIMIALEKGVNFIDTAPAYGNGDSEKIVGKAIKKYGKRENIIIGTKFGLNFKDPKKVFRDSRRASMMEELENSLKRLQVDYIDVYQCHWPDSKTPISETAETLKKMLDQGKIRAIGVSNSNVSQMEEFRKTVSINTNQFDFNIFENGAERDILPFSIKNHLATIGYSSICRGLLSGKMTTNTKFKGDDLRGGMDPKFKEPQFGEYVKCVHALDQWAKKKYDKPVIALAIRWVLDKGINIPLWGARRPDQLNEMDKVLGWHLTPEDFKEIDKIVKETVIHPVDAKFMAPPERE